MPRAVSANPVVRVDTPVETLAARLAALRDVAPDATAFEFVHSGRVQRLTRAEMMDRAARFAGAYAQRGIEPGSVVAIILQHDRAVVEAFVGAILAGLRPCILAFPTPKLDRTRWAAAIRALVGTTEAKLVITYDDLVADLRGLTGAGVVTVAELDGASASVSGVPRARPDDLAFLQFSSGTTGLQKGVALTHAAVLDQVDAYARAIGLSSKDHVVSWLPLYHDMGLVACTLLPLLTGTPFTWMSPFEWVARPEMLLEHIERTRSTLCWMPNFAFALLARTSRGRTLPDLSSVRAWINCSEPVTAAAFDAFLDCFGPAGVRPEGLSACYAMAENTFAVSQTRPGVSPVRRRVDRDFFRHEHAAIEPRIGHAFETHVSSGRPIAGVSLEVRSRSGTTVADGSVGSIWVRSSCAFGGYWPARGSTDDWFDTGDLGYLWDGELYVTGRSKDLLIVRGRNLYPHDIEAAAGGVDGVLSGRVVALGDDDEFETQRVLVLAETREPERTDIADAIRSACLRTLDLPDVNVHLVTPAWLLKTSSGKIARSANLRKFRSQGLPVRTSAPALPSDFGETVQRWIRGQVRREISPNETLGEVLDSLAFIDLFLHLEAEFGIPLGEEIRRNAPSLRLCDLLDRVDESVHRQSEGTEAMIRLAVGGDGSLASALINRDVQGLVQSRTGVHPNASVFFRRRIDVMLMDLDRDESELAAWSPDLLPLREADLVLIDPFAEMLASAEIRKRRPDEPARRDDLTAVRWLPTRSAVANDVAIESKSRLRPEEVVTAYDGLAERLEGLLLVTTYGERCASTYAWADWLIELNARLRCRAADAGWTLVDTGRAMDALVPPHYRAPFVPLPARHEHAARETLVEALATATSGLSPRRGAVVHGYSGRVRGAHSCVSEVTPEWLDLAARVYRRIAVIGPTWSAPGLEVQLERRGVQGERFGTTDDVPSDAGFDAALLVAGRYTGSAMEALAERLGGIPVESLLTQDAALGAEESLGRLALRELWRGAAFGDRRVGLLGGRRLARYARRVVADLPVPEILWDLDEPSDAALPEVDLVLVLRERDKDAQSWALGRARASGGRVVCPHAWVDTPTFPVAWRFAPHAAATFLVEGDPVDTEGLWRA